MNKLITNLEAINLPTPTFYNLYSTWKNEDSNAGGDRFPTFDEATDRRDQTRSGITIKVEVTPEKDFLITTVKEFK